LIDEAGERGEGRRGVCNVSSKYLVSGSLGTAERESYYGAVPRGRGGTGVKRIRGRGADPGRT